MTSRRTVRGFAKFAMTIENAAGFERAMNHCRLLLSGHRRFGDDGSTHLVIDRQPASPQINFSLQISKERAAKNSNGQ